MTILDQIIHHKSEILQLAEQYGIHDVRIFGSVARNEETINSDLDLLINVYYHKDPLAFLDFKYGVEKLLNRKVDILFENGIFEPIKQSILKEAKSIEELH